MKHVITIADMSADEVTGALQLAAELKTRHAKGNLDKRLDGKTVCLFFEKPSLRTRLSFEAAAVQLGAGCIFIGPDAGRLGSRESIADMARTSSRYCDIMVLRTFSHESIVEMAEHSRVPVINALSDYVHPCQALADMLTLREHVGALDGVKLAYIGDANNVARSLAFAAKKLGMSLTVASPEGYGFDDAFVSEMGGALVQTNDPASAVEGCQAVYTDVWTSMGLEDEREKRLKDFAGFRVDTKMLDAAAPGAILMHCLPAHRGEEVTAEAIESDRSVVFDQAENRMHLQRALLWELA